MDRVILNLGCGFAPMEGAINVDKYEICKPDEVWDLDKMPWPWKDHYADEIHMDQVLEHLNDWWAALRECARVLKIGGRLFVSVPDESNSNALAYRDHHHVFTWMSFHNLEGSVDRSGKNAFVVEQIKKFGKIPLRMEDHKRHPFPKYWWMVKWCPWLLEFLVQHMRNFCTEQSFVFLRLNDE